MLRLFRQLAEWAGLPRWIRQPVEQAGQEYTTHLFFPTPLPATQKLPACVAGYLKCEKVVADKEKSQLFIHLLFLIQVMYNLCVSIAIFSQLYRASWR